MGLPPLRIMLPAVASLSVLGAVFLLAVVPLTQITELGKELAFDNKMLNAHLTTVMPAGNTARVRFLSDGTLGRVKEPGGRYWEPEFEAAESEVFYSLPRNNAYTEFRVYRIDDDGVVIEYDARVHNLHGDNQLVSVDHGMVRLAWKEGQSRYVWPYPR